MDAERFRDLATRLLLEGLGPDEQAELERELERRGPAGEAELATLREVLAGVALQSRPVAPRPELRERVLATADGEARPVSGTAPDVSGQSLGVWRTAALLAAALALLLGIWNVRLREELQDSRRLVQEARSDLARVDSLERELETERGDLTTLGAREASTHELVGTESRPRARGPIFQDPATRRARVIVRELPVLQAGTLYELWAIRDGTPAPAATFVTDRYGRARVAVDAATLQGADVLAVTVEPAPGSQTPTGAIILSSPQS